MINKPAKKQWRKIDGWVLLNKPAGVTSNGILQQVRRIYSAKKAGHTGALDPFATGLLPICFGEATKISGLLLDSDKAYIATLQLGQATDSGDKDGKVVKEEEVPALTEDKIKSTLKEFVGDITQVPPMYSALKHQGKPLYYYARKGIEIERVARHVNILELVLESFNSLDEIKFKVSCSKGTYVRTLGEDIAKSLGTIGHLTALHRIKTGSLTADQMVSVATVEANKEACLLRIDLPLEHLSAIHLSKEQTKIVIHGGKLAVEKPVTDLVKYYDVENNFIGIGEWIAEKNHLKPKRLFNL